MPYRLKMINDTNLDPLVASAASKVAITAGSTTAIWGVFTHEVIFGLLGVLVAVITMFINWYYKRKADRLDEELKRKEDIREEREAVQRAEERALRIEIMKRNNGRPLYSSDPTESRINYE